MPVAHPSRRAGGALRFWLFGLYLACYAAFTILTAFDRPLMASAPFGGANLAVLSGLRPDRPGAGAGAPLLVAVPRRSRAGRPGGEGGAMIYAPSPIAVGVFVTFILFVIGLSAWLGRRAKSASGYYAAHGEIHWFVNGIAFAGDYLSAASFLGICGMIAFYGYDGFLYSIGYLAGWIVALFVIAEPLKRLGRFTFADALDSQFNSRGIKLAAAISTLVVSIFYLIPQMVGAGALIKPLLGLPHWVGVVLVGVVVILIVVTAGMVSTTWVQFIKGSLLVIFCVVLTVMILHRGLVVDGGAAESPFAARPAAEILARPGIDVLPEGGAWNGKPYARCRITPTGASTVWREETRDGVAGSPRRNGSPSRGTARDSSTACRRARARASAICARSAMSRRCRRGRRRDDRSARPGRLPRHAAARRRSCCGARSASSRTTARRPRSTTRRSRDGDDLLRRRRRARRSTASAAPSCSTSSISSR